MASTRTKINAKYQGTSDKLTSYSPIIETDSEILRSSPEGFSKWYNEARAEWKKDSSNPIRMPPKRDTVKLAAHFARCEELCAVKAQGMADAAKLVLYTSFSWQAPEAVKWRSPRSTNSGFENRKDLSLEDANATPSKASATATAATPTAISPTISVRSRVTVPEMPWGTHQDFTFVNTRHASDGKTSRCIVLDCGWPWKLGDFYEVAIDDREPGVISTWDMREMWVTRVVDV
ncbi:hypothetical protein FRB95_004832 [Tulasnella sp. JGI-2019a]|nr:hypothetical protein FRB95_004832 [Tulasnella sp. JGI-2019a]